MNNEKQYILALDQGTTSSRAIVFNKKGEIISSSQKEFKQIYPKPSWVEHDPQEIWSTQAAVAAESVAKLGLNGKNIAAIGITNQRETTIVWDITTNQPIYNAIVWQDRRTARFCDTLKNKYSKIIHDKTGLIIDAYFSASKIHWILENVKGAREKAEKGLLRFGTVDSWLIWRLTNGKKHITDVTNASRTMLFNIHTLKWDKRLLKIFDIPKSMLPSVKDSSSVYTKTATTLFATKIPIAGIAGDQQAALFGQMCIKKGMIKNTYGTGCFLMMNTGTEAVNSNHKLLTTIAWKIGDEVNYALEGSVFVGGAAIQWLRDGLQIIKKAKHSEKIANEVKDSEGVVFVPALTGLGAPYWDQYARGTLIGITRGTKRAHIVRATLEAIALQSYDVIESMLADTGNKAKEIRVDGGAAANNLLMQIQSDITNVKVIRTKVMETTALGAAFLAGLSVGYWKDIDEIQNIWQEDASFEANMKKEKRDLLKEKWKNAVERSLNWDKN
ncbi:glycerol kinase GlpK [Flammeovirga kamogawensis]|uniref:Glycerol kinase n=1 Tax=Flammeovirga kamogawensis TaxID=373891 RepID=A0ABX8GRG4_9BACT|nr:glycerol kinase GlpK [Flammeovirga kamogawensis]MBB6462047.1 glycerol kinase [Flammeovirga kamogawensis]QWG05782.1 glycerol kinase GlpK [Flammeovirga kamogawensis]TRX67609.1 glycerol kinase GlpK [Flammeovirga kamogawensis]